MAAAASGFEDRLESAARCCTSGLARDLTDCDSQHNTTFVSAGLTVALHSPQV